MSVWIGGRSPAIDLQTRCRQRRFRQEGASSKEVFLEVWYRNAEELKHRAADPNAFVVALAKAKDDQEFPPVFDKFVGIFRVIPTGIPLSENSIETKILERVRLTMKFATDRPLAEPDQAARKLVDIANASEAVQNGRIYIELINGPFLKAGGTPGQFHAALARAITLGWLQRHESGTYVKFTQAGADLFA